MRTNVLDQLIVLRLHIKDDGFLYSFHGTNTHQLLALQLHKNVEG